ncbi:hypothetical protein ACFL35_03740 [Candidatus Riflebacteria bacterium]
MNAKKNLLLFFYLICFATCFIVTVEASSYFNDRSRTGASKIFEYKGKVRNLFALLFPGFTLSYSMDRELKFKDIFIYCHEEKAILAARLLKILGLRLNFKNFNFEKIPLSLHTAPHGKTTGKIYQIHVENCTVATILRTLNKYERKNFILFGLGSQKVNLNFDNLHGDNLIRFIAMMVNYDLEFTEGFYVFRPEIKEPPLKNFITDKKISFLGIINEYAIFQYAGKEYILKKQQKFKDFKLKKIYSDRVRLKNLQEKTEFFLFLKNPDSSENTKGN